MKPLGAVKPIEKLPITYHLTIVKDPDKSIGMFNVVLTEMQGKEVRRQKVLDPAEPSMDHALDQLNRTATRVYYFGEGEEMVAP